MNKLKREHIYLIFIISIIICIFQYGIHKICGFSVYPDEFGYWASAAKTVGYDWTEVASLGSYYSFGYSVLLMPVLKLFSDGVIAYRAAIAVNMLLMCLSLFAVYYIIIRLFPETDNPEIDRIKRVFISGIAVLYPSWILYMQMTLAEALLMFLFIGVTYMFVRLIQKPGIITAVLLAVELIYSYCVHMRTVGVVIACLFTLLLWGIVNPAMRKQILIMLVVVAIAGLAVVVIKRNVILSVFANADKDTLAVNDYGSQIERIRRIFVSGGIETFVKEIIAKFFYLGMATYGFFYWAIGWCLKETINLLKAIFTKRIEKCAVTGWIAMFLLLSVISEVLICSIFMHGSTLIDSLIYGRYNEFLVPVLMVVGIAAMFKSRWVLRITLLMGIVSGGMVFPILSVIEEEKMEGIRGCFIAGISYLLNEGSFTPSAFFRKTWIVSFVWMMLAAGIVLVVRRWNRISWLLGIIMILEIMLGIQVSTKYVYNVNRFGFQDSIIAEKILENSDKDVSVYYLDEGVTPYIDFQQMQLQDITIHVIDGKMTEQISEMGDFFIVSCETERKEELSQIYNRHIISNLHILYFNQID